MFCSLGVFEFGAWRWRWPFFYNSGWGQSTWPKQYASADLTLSADHVLSRRAAVVVICCSVVVRGRPPPRPWTSHWVDECTWYYTCYCCWTQSPSRSKIETNSSPSRLQYYCVCLKKEKKSLSFFSSLSETFFPLNTCRITCKANKKLTSDCLRQRKTTLMI